MPGPVRAGYGLAGLRPDFGSRKKQPHSRQDLSLSRPTATEPSPHPRVQAAFRENSADSPPESGKNVKLDADDTPLFRKNAAKHITGQNSRIFLLRPGSDPEQL